MSSLASSTRILIVRYPEVPVMKLLRGLLYIAVLNVFGYYTFKIQIVGEKLTPIDISLVVTCLGLASIVGIYRQRQNVELTAARTKY